MRHFFRLSVFVDVKVVQSFNFLPRRRTDLKFKKDNILTIFKGITGRKHSNLVLFRGVARYSSQRTNANCGFKTNAPQEDKRFENIYHRKILVCYKNINGCDGCLGMLVKRRRNL